MADYVWGIFHFTPPIPNGDMFHQASKDECQFYPFSHKGSIFTIDSSLWSDKTYAEEIIYPDPDTIEAEISRKVKKSHQIIELVAFHANSIVPTINRDLEIEIYKISNQLNDFFDLNYKLIGFDIVDVSGLSGLANIGYNYLQSEHIKNTCVEINKYGLVNSAKHAEQLAKFFSIAVPEHAPFFPLEIWMQNY